jgi:hypothetical protein
MSVRGLKPEDLVDDSDDEQVDFLEVDNPLPGQNFGCVSFLSPEKEIAQKNDYISYNFYKYQLKQAMKIVNHHLNTLEESLSTNDEQPSNEEKSQTEDSVDVDEKVVESVNVNDIRDRIREDLENVKLSDTVNRQLYERMQKTGEKASELKEEKSDYISFSEFKQDYLDELENYRVVNDDRMQGEYDDAVDFNTNIRGVKLRGNFETYKEAKMRAKLLQKRDANFHVWVAQVGYWVPFDAEPDKAPSSEYQENALQKIAEEKKKNEERREILQIQRREEEKKIAAMKNKKAKEEQKKLKEEEAKIENVPQEPDQTDVEPVEPTETLTTDKIEELLAQRREDLDIGENIAKKQTQKPDMSSEMMQAGFGGSDPWMARKMESSTGDDDDDDDDDDNDE